MQLLIAFFTKEELCESLKMAEQEYPHLREDELIPAIDEDILNALFVQARKEFPQFREGYRDRFSRTMIKLRKLCRLLGKSDFLKRQRRMGSDSSDEDNNQPPFAKRMKMISKKGKGKSRKSPASRDKK